MTNINIRFTAIGDCGVDRYVSYNKDVPGGTALNSAVYAKRSGAEASIISAIGTDTHSDIPLSCLKSEEVNTSQLSQTSGKTNIVDITLSPEGNPEYGTWDLGVLESFRLNKSHEVFLNTQHIVTAVHLPELRHMFDGLAYMELPDVLKVADFTDLSEYNGDINVIETYLDLFDVVCLSIDASDKDRLAEYYELLEQKGKLGIAMMGENGSAVYHKGNLTYQQAHKVKVVDTTGAGDSYLATFLVTYFQTKDIYSSMEKATKVASKVIQSIGAIT